MLMPFGVRKATIDELRKEIAALQKAEKSKDQKKKEAQEYKELLRIRNELKYPGFEKAKRGAGKAFDALGRGLDNVDPPLHGVGSKKRRPSKGVDFREGLFGGV